MSHASPRRPKILVVGPTPPPFNGMSVATSTVLDVLEQRFRIIHLDTADRRPLSRVGRLDLKNILLALVHGIRFLILLMRRRPNVVYVPIAQSTLGFLRDAGFLIPCRLLGVRTVVHLHGGHFATFHTRASRPMRAVIRLCLRRVALAIVLGESLRGTFDGILPRSRIAVVPNGVNDFCGGYIDRATPATDLSVLFLSTLRESKGMLDVLRAVPSVRKQVPSVEFVFVGEWGDARTEARARTLVRDLGIASSVRFPGAQQGSEKEETLRRSHLLVLPSYVEGQPLSILEAMCASLPVIASRAGCIPETVIDGICGTLLPSRDPGILATAIEQTLLDPDLYRKMASASRERFERLYTSRRFGADLACVLSRACGRAGHGQAELASESIDSKQGRAEPVRMRGDRHGAGA